MPAPLDIARLSELTCQVLMEAAFVMAEPTPAAPALEGKLLAARIAFTGPCRGRVTLTTTARLAITLAANLLGVDPDDDEAADRGGDALSELLNMVGGALLGAVCPPGSMGHLGLPESMALEAEPPPRGNSVTLLTDEGEAVVLQLELEPCL